MLLYIKLEHLNKNKIRVFKNIISGIQFYRKKDNKKLKH